MGTCRELESYFRLALDVVGAEGCELILRDGRRVLDLYGGHCVNVLGAGDASMRAALDRQWNELSFVTNLIDHDARAAFLETVGPLLPEGAWSLFASNSGAEANESALKVACSTTGRGRIVTFCGAFHGRTAAAHAISDVQKRVFGRLPFEVLRIPFGDIEAATGAIDDTVAAVVIEPIQSMAGVVCPPVGYLAGLRRLCDASGALLVFDEVQTASGRTGQPFCAQTYGVTPDVITTAKGAGGGFPVGFTFVIDTVAERVERFLLGSTFGGGPLAFAAAAVVARSVAAPGFLENVRETSSALRKAARVGPVQEVRGEGLLLGLVLEQGMTASSVRDELLNKGILVGTSNDRRVVRLSPPLVLAPEAATRLADALETMEVTA